ncbi:hypothetical protein SAMN06265795_102254 [Noviherbaspirillum humi]|uniref:Uncharacterized protein n=2 Tax=Noviherbaspirillum humi TaxID=1688639 RepID=A0A239DKV5_9BURK|nr:hypothetical protein SAMN06265795_102254 [Noviherbaspirillum humi]
MDSYQQALELNQAFIDAVMEFWTIAAFPALYLAKGL